MHLFNAGRAIPPGRKSATRNGWANFLFRNASGHALSGYPFIMHIHTYICGTYDSHERESVNARAKERVSFERRERFAMSRYSPACRDSSELRIIRRDRCWYMKKPFIWTRWNITYHSSSVVLWTRTRGTRYTRESQFQLDADGRRYFVLR